MYYEERLIDGIWCFRHNPTDAFKPMSTTQLNKKIADLNARLSVAENAMFKMREELKEGIVAFIEAL